METREEIQALTSQYMARFPAEEADIQQLVGFTDQFSGEAMISRKNFIGHITTSAFIVDPDRRAVLLLKHKFLDRWLQPGGHVDPADACLTAAAVREAVEETGFAAEDLLLLSTEIFDIDSHPIPANEKKQEPPHVHHDIRFLFQCSDRGSLSISADESTDGKWFDISELNGNPDFFWFQEKLAHFI